MDTASAGAARPVSGPPPERPADRPPVWARLTVVAIFAAAAAFLAVWTVDMVAPARALPAVITHDEQTWRDLPDGVDIGYRVEARADDGRAVDLGGRAALGHAVGYGEPVVLRVSRATGNIVGVRTVDEHVRLRIGRWELVGLAVSVLAVVSALTWARSVWSGRPAAATVAAAVLPALLVGWASVRGPAIGATRQVPVDHGMSSYDLGALPARAVPAGTPATAGGFTVTVTGPVARGAPAGAPDWLRDFHVLQVPVLVAFAGTGLNGYVRVELIGPGRGTAQVVRAPACGGVPGAFGGDARAGQPPVAGPACFVVPAGFEPRYLVFFALAGPGAVLALPPG